MVERSGRNEALQGRLLSSMEEERADEVRSSRDGVMEEVQEQ